jgi:hypothetical protein
MNWVSSVIGFAVSGYVLENLGANSLYLISAALSLAAAGLIRLLAGLQKKALTTAPSAQPVHGQPGSPSAASWAINYESAEKTC